MLRNREDMSYICKGHSEAASTEGPPVPGLANAEFSRGSCAVAHASMKQQDQHAAVEACIPDRKGCSASLDPKKADRTLTLPP